MAAVWWDAFQKVESIITAPKDTGVSDVSTGSKNICEKKPGVGRGPIQTQKGSGEDDGKYVHASESKGELLSFTRDQSVTGFWFADVFGSGLDSLLEFTTNSAGHVCIH
jgi:hypothetical protein